VQVCELMMLLCQEQNAAMIIVTHDAQLAQRMQRRYRLAGGKLELNHA